MSCARLTAPYYMKKPTVTDRKVMPFANGKTLERKSREKELGYLRKRFCHPLQRIPAVRRVFISERRFPCGKIVKFYEKGYATY